MSQTTFGSDRESEWYRTIVKDAYTTRDAHETSDTTLEVVAWRVQSRRWLPGTRGQEGVEDPIKTFTGRLLYGKILAKARDELGTGEISRRTKLKSYADEKGGRAESTIRGYDSETLRNLTSSHPVKRVLRRWARSQDLGHFEDDEATDEEPAIEPREGEWIGKGEIDLDAMKRAYKLARSIASQEGFVFAPQEGEPVAVEDNERIDEDEVRQEDRPLGDTKGAVLLVKPTGKTYEYRVHYDEKTLERVYDEDLPPGGWA